MIGQDDGELLAPVDVAALLGVPVATVYKWRSKGQGPPGHKVGRHVRYVHSEVMHWLRDQP